MKWWPFKPGRQANVNPPPTHARPPMPPYPVSKAGLVPTADMVRRWEANCLDWPAIDSSLIPLKED